MSAERELLRTLLATRPGCVSIEASGCWEWRKSRNIHGYGKVKHQRQWIGAHVFVWVLAHGAVPPGMQLDHLCRNRACVRPAHLEPVTASENIRRGRAAKGAYEDCPKHGSKVRNALDLSVCMGCRAERARIRRQRLHGTPPPRHGTRSSYATYGCRCPECVDAQHAYARSRREIVREPL